jgi:bifunctional N-acetylglucosamine-1-phosphate-uridyltransferase/glucosamine-1-phosphate-acetyltransferase GlmU-like protein
LGTPRRAQVRGYLERHHTRRPRKTQSSASRCTVTCNYDGVKKNPTVIEDRVFIGSDNMLVAPVRIGQGSYTAAGSAITEDVPAHSLAIARSPQVTKQGWVKERG